MVDLTAKMPLTGLDDTIGTCRLRAFDPGAVWSIAPYPGRDPGLPNGRFPDPGQVIAMDAGRLVWTGRQQAFLMGEALPEGIDAAITDQTEAWAWVRLSGEQAADVLARVCPLDFRDKAFPVGSSARSLLGHMSAIYIRAGAELYEIAVFCSMAETLKHELTRAMRHVAARG